MMLITFIQWTNFNVQTCPDKWPMHMVHTVSSKNERKRNSLPVIIPMMDENKRITLKWTIPWIFSYWVLNISPCNEMGLHMSGKEKTLWPWKESNPQLPDFINCCSTNCTTRHGGKFVLGLTFTLALYIAESISDPSFGWLMLVTQCSLCPDINWRKKNVMLYPYHLTGHGKTAASASIPSKYQTIVSDSSERKGFLFRSSGLLTWIWYA